MKRNNFFIKNLFNEIEINFSYSRKMEPENYNTRYKRW